MTELIPKWVFAAYAKLWKEYQGKPFTFKEANDHLGIEKQRALSEIFSELRNANWLTSKPDPKSRRHRIFRLRKANLIFKELLDKYAK